MKKLQEILPLTIKNLGLTKKYNAEWVILNWRKIVGEEIAAKAYPTSVQRGVMVISVNNSVWCHHLSMMKEEIIAKINTFSGEKLITDIRFQAGYLAKYQNNEENQENSISISKKIKSIKLDDNEINHAKEMVNSIGEEQLQHKILPILKKHLAFKKLKKLNDWHKCANCETLCPKGALYCTVCDIEYREQKQSKIRQLLSEAPWFTYAELRNYFDCTPEEYINAKTAMLAVISQDINSGQTEKVKVLTLVMLATGAKPGEITEKLIQQTLEKFGRKKYVSASRI